MNLEQEQDAQLDESSTSQPEAQPAADQSEAAPAPEVEAAPKDVPFHEHPRFREVIEQKNKFAEDLRREQLERTRMQAQLEMLMKSREKQDAPQEAPIFQKLDGIDPEFAKVMREMYTSASSVKQLQQDLQELRQYRETSEANQGRAQALAEVSRLHNEYKVPAPVQSFYQARLEQIAAQEGDKLSMKDLPNVYKRIHDEFNGFLETTKRQNLAGYVQDKTKDAKAPAPQPKGQAPGAQKSQYSSNPEEAKAQLIKNVLKQARASKDI